MSSPNGTTDNFIQQPQGIDEYETKSDSCILTCKLIQKSLVKDADLVECEEVPVEEWSIEHNTPEDTEINVCGYQVTLNSPEKNEETGKKVIVENVESYIIGNCVVPVENDIELSRENESYACSFVDVTSLSIDSNEDENNNIVQKMKKTFVENLTEKSNCQSVLDNSENKENQFVSLTRLYHSAAERKSVSQMICNSDNPKRKLDCGITTKIIDLALPVNQKDCNYVIDTDLGTVSQSTTVGESPPKYMKFDKTYDIYSQINGTKPNDDKNEDSSKTKNSQSGNIFPSYPAEKNAPTYHFGQCQLTDSLPYAVASRSSTVAVPMFSGSDIYNAAHMSGICDANGNLRSPEFYLANGGEESHSLVNSGKIHYIVDGELVPNPLENDTQKDIKQNSPFEHFRLPCIFPSSANTNNKGKENRRKSDLQPNRMDRNSKEKTPGSPGVQVLSTWKVNVNKSQHTQNVVSSDSLLNNFSNSSKNKPVQFDRTPHPNVGRMYMPDGGQHLHVYDHGLSRLFTSTPYRPRSPYLNPALAPLVSIKQDPYGSICYTPFSSSMHLNSSGSDEGPSPPDYLARNLINTPYNTPTQGISSPTPSLPTAGQLNAALFRAKESLTESEMDLGRQTHNAKERARRARIKSACEHLRDLVPGMTMKTDKATVFEFAVQYIAYLRHHVGIQFDKDFLRTCNPY